MTKGILYCATQKKYLVEAATSVKSLRKYHDWPAAIVVPIHLINEPEIKYFNKILTSNFNEVSTYGSKIFALQLTPYESTLFLDGDTFIGNQINGLFDILDYCDLSLCPERNNYHTVLNNYGLRCYESISEFNTGVILFRNSDKVKAFLNLWKELYIKFYTVTYIDQLSFREAILESDIKLLPLNIEYNFRGIASGQIAAGEVKILHERLSGWSYSNANLEQIKKLEKRFIIINKSKAKRIVLSVFAFTLVFKSRYMPINLFKSILRKFKLLKIRSKRESY
jgi:hypothetical protein